LQQVVEGSKIIIFHTVNLLSGSGSESLVLLTKEIPFMTEIFGVYVLEAE
jgi:hypothetical protein